MLERIRENRWAKLVFALYLVAVFAFSIAVHVWMVTVMSAMTAAVLLPLALKPWTDRLDGLSIERLSTAQRIALAWLFGVGFSTWRVVEDGWVAVPFLIVGLVGLTAWLAWTVRRDGWSGKGGSSAG